MKTYEEFLIQEDSELTEALITFAGQAYPKFGNVIIMAGGAASGKGFIKNKLIGAEGFVFDVDEIKLLAMKAPGIIAKIKTEFDVDISNLSLSNPENVFKLHTIVGDHLKLDDKKKAALFTSVIAAAPDRKPNLIFDVTMKSLTQLQKYTIPIQMLGYDPKKIHLVWVVNDIEVAIAQNISRGQKPGGRTVPVEILVNTHAGASQTMNDIVNMGTALRKYLDGDIVFAFNKAKVDSDNVESGGGGSYIKKANYFYVKRSGKAVDPAKMNADIRAKIASYVPKGADWQDVSVAKPDSDLDYKEPVVRGQKDHDLD